MAVTVKMVSNTDYCFNCETVYEICKDSVTDNNLLIDIKYYSPGNKVVSFPKEIYELEDKQITESVPIYETITEKIIIFFLIRLLTTYFTNKSSVEYWNAYNIKSSTT